MARSQVVPKKGSNPGSAGPAKKEPAAKTAEPSARPQRRADTPPGREGQDGRDGRDGRDVREAREGSGRPARETRPVSTRAALGFKDDD